MSDVEVEIIEKIRSLPAEQQRDLAGQIWSEFGEENLSPEQTAELDRRLAEFEKNPRAGIPWEQVQAEVNRRFGWQ